MHYSVGKSVVKDTCCIESDLLHGGCLLPRRPFACASRRLSFLLFIYNKIENKAIAA